MAVADHEVRVRFGQGASSTVWKKTDTIHYITLNALLGLTSLHLQPSGLTAAADAPLVDAHRPVVACMLSKNDVRIGKAYDE